MKVRPNTWDAAITQNVLVNNEYNLPEDMSGMTVVDIGAHIGSFAVACHARGAKRVICYEPDADNFELLTLNVQGLTDTTAFELWSKAVTGERTENLKLRRLRNHDFGNGPNTGHIDVFGFADKGGITSISIADVLDAVGGPVDLLKIDCEGSEWSIFEHGDFSNVSRIVAELHAVVSGEHALADGIKGQNLRGLAQQAVRTLVKNGFAPKLFAVSDDVGMLIASKAAKTVRPATKKVLWLGHAGIPSGYAKVTENICRRLFDMGWDVRIYGIGYNGYPHSMPYRIYPANETGNNLKSVVETMQPDVIVALDDHWNVSIRIQALTSQAIYTPIVGYVAVDSENVRKDVAAQFRSLKHAIFHTEFGVQELAKAGYNGLSSVAGHGVDTSIFMPYDKIDAREKVNIALSKDKLKDAFIWGVVGMNQPRKRLDLSLAYFAAWWKAEGKPKNAYIYLHCDHGGVYDLTQLVDYLGIKGRILTTSSDHLSEAQLPSMYSIFDAMISTAEGESWGMCQHEGLACGVPQIAVKCGGMPYWAKDAIYWVEPSQYAFTPNRTNTKRWIASESDFVAAMTHMYSDAELREDYSRRGLELVKSLPSWDDIAMHFHEVLLQVIKRTEDAVLTDTVDEFAQTGSYKAGSAS